MLNTGKSVYTAVVPARSGSRRIKDKNVAPFAGSNLLVHKVRQLKKVPSIDTIVVSSDSDAYLSIARAEGALTHKRDPEYAVEGAGQTKSFGEAVRHIAEGVEGTHVVWCQPTSPLVTSEIYKDAIETYRREVLEKDFHDSLASVEIMQKHIWDDNGPVNYKRGKGHVLSQQLPKWYFVTGVFIAPRLKMIEWCHNIGEHPYMYPLQKINCVDIDDELDLEVARAWHDKACTCLGRDL